MKIAAIVLLAAAVSAADGPAPVHTVRIDAVAVDARGRTVDNLNAADFELFEDGAARTIESARFARGDAPVAVAIFLDEYHVSKDALIDRIRGALERFIDRGLRPNDQLVVLKPLESLVAIRLTADREAARAAIASFEGRKGNYEPRSAYERNFIAGTPARVEAARAQVSWSAINALAVQLGSAGEGRKTLIVVSEGIGRPERRRGQESLPTVDTVARSANRSTVAVYTLDPRVAPIDDDDQRALRQLAAASDGDAIGADVDAALARAIGDARAHYLLTYRAPHVEDGGFHDVRVRVKRAGVQLRTRSGYWAPSPDDVLRAALIAKLNEPVAPPRPPEPARHVSTTIRPWFGLSRGAAGHTRVTMVWEPAARVPGDRGRRDAARVELTALAPNDAVLFEGVVRPTGPAAIAGGNLSGSRAVFEAQPGRVRLRMTIKDATGQPLDVDVRDLTIPDLGRDVAIGTPEVLRARNAREFRLLEQAAAPVASREFSRSERLLIRFPAYASSGAPAVSAKLLSRMGQAMRDLTVTRGSEPAGLNEIDLPLAGLASGDYIIEVTVSAAGIEAKDRLSFRVTS